MRSVRTRVFALACSGIGAGTAGPQVIEQLSRDEDQPGAGGPGRGPGGTIVEPVGLPPVVEGSNLGMRHDIRRTEIIALPLVQRHAAVFGPYLTF